MSCVKNDCVEETLKRILKAQKVADERNACDSDCERAIENLRNSEKTNTKNTVPFALYTKDGLPFKADGVGVFHCSCCNKEKFAGFATFIFKIIKFKDSCATIELLKFKRKESCCAYEYSEPSSPAQQVDCEDVDDLISTGVCITIDPDCFCSILCLPAIHLESVC